MNFQFNDKGDFMKNESGYTVINPAFAEGRVMFKIALAVVVVLVILANV